MHLDPTISKCESPASLDLIHTKISLLLSTKPIQLVGESGGTPGVVTDQIFKFLRELDIISQPKILRQWYMSHISYISKNV